MIATALQPDLFEPYDPIEGTDTTTAVLYRCRPCERNTKRTHVWRRSFSGITTQPPADRCITCKQLTAGTAIRGRYSAVHACDARCIYAKGPNCECSCGGANHGVGHTRL